MKGPFFLIVGGLCGLVAFTYAFNIFPFQIDFPKPRYEIFPSIPIEIEGEEFFITTIRVTNLGGTVGTNVVFGVEFRHPIARFESSEGKGLDKKSYTEDGRQVVAGFNRIETGEEIAVTAITRKEGQRDEAALNPYMYTEEKVGSKVETYRELNLIEMKYKFFVVMLLTSLSTFFLTLHMTGAATKSSKHRSSKDRRSHRRSSKKRLPTTPPPPPGGGAPGSSS